MSDCSRNAMSATYPIHGEIHWGGGMRPTPLSYARYVNGHERVAEHVELDGVRYVPEGGRDGLEEAYLSLQAHFDKTRERWMQRGVCIAKQRERIGQLESLVRFMEPFFEFAVEHGCGCPDDYCEPHGCDDGCKALKELDDRMAALGLLEGDGE